MHRWLTFVAGVLILLVTVSGAVVVFADEIDRALNPALYRATAGDAGVDGALAAVRRAYPAREAASIAFPRGARPVYIVALRGEPALAVHVDPGTARVLGARDRWLTAWLQTLHVSLFVIPGGVTLVGVVGAVLLLMLATGAYLWWPGLRRLATRLRLRRRAGAAAAMYDVHNIVGALSLPVVALVTLTGVMIAFGGLTRRVVHLFVPGPMPQPAVIAPPPPAPDGAAPLPLDVLVRAARDTLPGYEPLTVHLPGEPGGAVQVWFYDPRMPSSEPDGRVVLDRYGGGVLGLDDPRLAAQPDHFLGRWPYALHVGGFGGVGVRVVYAVLGLAPAALAGTGLFWWWSRRRRGAARP